MVACREEASVGYRDREDIVMITDPDRMEVPTVYTLAGNRAVIIHSTPDMHNIPLGIYSDSKDPVVVRFSGVEAFSVPVYLYDAETQTVDTDRHRAIRSCPFPATPTAATSCAPTTCRPTTM